MDGTELVLAERGRAVLAYMAHDRDCDGRGSVQGGVIATLLDTAMGRAVASLLDPRDGFTTTELRTSYRRPVGVASGPLRAEAGVLHIARATALVEARLVDAEGRLFAHATATWALDREATLAA